MFLRLTSLGGKNTKGFLNVYYFMFDTFVFYICSGWSDIIEKFGDTQNIENKIRIGGLVLESSIKKEDEKTIFMITDRKKEVKVEFKGPLPDLFREGQGIVAEGMFQNNNFIASEVLAKHDENYMPPEVADALKKNNVWKGDSN